MLNSRIEGVHWSLDLLVTQSTQDELVAEPLALNCTGECVLLTHNFQDYHITLCVIMDPLIVGNVQLIIRFSLDIGSMLVQYVS